MRRLALALMHVALVMGCAPECVPNVQLPACHAPLSSATSLDAFAVLQEDGDGARTLTGTLSWRHPDCSPPVGTVATVLGTNAPMFDTFGEIEVADVPGTGDIVMELEGGSERLKAVYVDGLSPARGYVAVSPLPARRDEDLVLEWQPSSDDPTLEAISMVPDDEITPGGTIVFAGEAVPLDGWRRIALPLADFDLLEGASALTIFPHVDVPLEIACEFAECRAELKHNRSVVVPLAPAGT